MRRGERTAELLKQNVYEPLPVENQIVLLKVNDKGLLDKLAVDAILNFQAEFLDVVTSKYEKEMANLAVTGLLTDELGEQILATASHIIEQINAA